LFCFTLIAYLPDFPLPGWGHFSYHVSHSVWVNLALVFVFLLIIWKTGMHERIGKLRALFFAALAWISHIVLDCLYNHGNGLMLMWPFGNGHLILPVPWFETLSLPMKSVHNLKVFAIEFLFYFPILVVFALLRRPFVRS
jgi:hypothetical protein